MPLLLQKVPVKFPVLLLYGNQSTHSTRCNQTFALFVLEMHKPLIVHIMNDVKNQRCSLQWCNHVQLFLISAETLHSVDTCSLGLIVKLPAVGFMQATYCVLWISFKLSFCRSYLETAKIKRRGNNEEREYSFVLFFARRLQIISQWLLSPVPVIEMLPYERVRLHCAINVNGRHVHIVYKVDHSPVAYRGVAPASSPLQRSLQSP